MPPLLFTWGSGESVFTVTKAAWSPSHPHSVRRLSPDSVSGLSEILPELDQPVSWSQRSSEYEK